MTIVLIRHAKVDMTWEKNYTSEKFDLDCERYNRCNILPPIELFHDVNSMKTIYISDLSRTYDTAKQLFNRMDFYQTALFNEVPLKSFKDTTKVYPLFVWNLIGRLQWAFNQQRQPESRAQSILRAKKAIMLLEEYKNDCCVVTHGFFIRVFINQLRQKGYIIKKSKKFWISNLEKIIAFKETGEMPVTL